MSKPWYLKMLPSARNHDFATVEAKAADADAESQFGLGLRYAVGVGTAQDLTRARYWYRKAADQDHALAQFNLGLMYAEGQGVAHDDEQALFWIRKGAEGGDAGAQFNLGMRCHRTSLGASPAAAIESTIEAYKWFTLAALKGYHNSDASSERLAIVMTREQVDEANRRVSLFGKAMPQPREVAAEVTRL